MPIKKPICFEFHDVIIYKPCTMANKLLIALEDVVLSFGGKPLFQGINLFVNEGDKICLVGKNGAGKTTSDAA